MAQLFLYFIYKNNRAQKITLKGYKRKFAVKKVKKKSNFFYFGMFCKGF